MDHVVRYYPIDDDDTNEKGIRFDHLLLENTNDEPDHVIIMFDPPESRDAVLKQVDGILGVKSITEVSKQKF